VIVIALPSNRKASHPILIWMKREPKDTRKVTMI
jgi:hypothetical protein